jgi:hypothetical protein
MEPQHIWTPNDSNILSFLMEKKRQGYRIVSVAAHVKRWYDGRGVEKIKQVGYIVIGEGEHPKEGE